MHLYGKGKTNLEVIGNTMQQDQDNFEIAQHNVISKVKDAAQLPTDHYDMITIVGANKRMCFFKLTLPPIHAHTRQSNY